MSSTQSIAVTMPTSTVLNKLRTVFFKSSMWVGGSTAFVWALWVSMGKILQSEVGLELFDEVLHVLAASHGFESATFYHQFPWAWHTRPLFLLAGGDVATFRTLGGVLLFLSAFLLGFGVEQFSSKFALFPNQKGTSLWWAISIGLVLGISSLTYYSGMLRSPSYNWVSLVGFLVALNGLLLFLSREKGEKSTEKGKLCLSLLSVGLFSTGAFFTIPARPTTMIYLLFVSSLLVFIYGRWRELMEWSLANLISLSFLTVAAIGFGLWPRQAIPVLIQAATRERSSDINYFADCSIDRSTGLIGGFETLFCVPEIFFSDLADQPALQVAGLSVLVASIAFFRETLVVSPVTRYFAMGMVTIFGLWIAVGGSFVAFEYLPAQRWALMTDQVTGALLIWGGSLMLLASERRGPGNRLRWVLWLTAVLTTIWGLHLDLFSERFAFTLGASWLASLSLLVILRGSWPSFGRQTSSGGSMVEPNRPRLLFFLSISLVGGAFVLGFGSSLGAYRVAPVTTVLVFAAALVVVAATNTRLERLVGLVLIAMASTLLSFLVVSDGLNRPWNNEPLGQQTTRTQVIPGKASLLLDEQTSRTISRLTGAAKESGWSTGTPILDYTRSGLLLPLVLGADVVPSLTLSLNWHPVEAERNFDVANSQGFRFDSAWIGISTHEALTDSDREFQKAMVERGESYTDLEFPEDYELVAKAGGFELWAPKDRI